LDFNWAKLQNNPIYRADRYKKIGSSTTLKDKRNGKSHARQLTPLDNPRSRRHAQ
jgi:hypothetical protein